MVKASAIDEDGNELYPTKWNHDFIDMPQINPREQRQPTFAADQIEKIIKLGDRRVQMFAILWAASGLRAGELFGLEVKHFNGSSITIEQEAWSGLIQEPKNRERATHSRVTPQRGQAVEEFHRAADIGLYLSKQYRHPHSPKQFPSP